MKGLLKEGQYIWRGAIVLTVAILLVVGTRGAIQQKRSRKYHLDSYDEIRDFKDVLDTLPYTLKKEDKKRLIELNKQMETLFEQNKFEKVDELTEEIDKILESYHHKEVSEHMS